MKQQNKHKITFQIEDLKRATHQINENSYSDILKGLFLKDLGLSNGDLAETEENELLNKVVAKNKISGRLVDFGYHAFLNGMHCAYAEHRPFIISPDMIWLLISQGFAHHVKNNSEELRNLIVKLEGKLSLLVRDDRIDLDKNDSAWEEAFPQFTKQLKGHIGNELVELLTADFTTTSITEKIASEITIMKAMEDYFEFCIMFAVCGIPEITIEGMPDDWNKIIKKSNGLRKYKLDWWIDNLQPILNEFLNASKKQINTDFWRNMFKFHTPDEYGAPDLIDGWITNFFPYDKQGNKTKIPIEKGEDGTITIQDEIVTVNFEHIKVEENGTKQITQLELWTGFVGLEQNSENFALRPKIGWIVNKKDTYKAGLKKELTENHKMLRVNKFPKEIFGIEKINGLDIKFTNKIDVPTELKNVKFNYLGLYGKISWKAEIHALRILDTNELWINDTIYKTIIPNALIRFVIGKLRLFFKKIRVS
jgi:hypothetical protein